MKYKNGTITNRPNVPVSNPSDATLLDYGWKTYVNIQPEYNPETHKIERSGIIESDTQAVQQYAIIELTADEIAMRNYDPMDELAKTLRSEMNGKIDRIADIIEGASGQQWSTDKKVIADKIKRQK